MTEKRDEVRGRKRASGGGEKERMSFIQLCTAQMPVAAMPGLGWREKPGTPSGSPTCRSVIPALEPSLAAKRHRSRGLDHISRDLDQEKNRWA